jgi:hypothetical protein
MKLIQGLQLLVSCMMIWGCAPSNTTLCKSSDTRVTQPPGTKITKDDSKDTCACEAVANEFSVCCDGCPWGDAIDCRSSSIPDPSRPGININVCAGQSEVTEPNPRCSLENAYVTAILDPELTYVGNVNSGPSNFQWGWYNPHTSELPDSDTLIAAERIRSELILRGKHSDGSEAEEEVGWDESIDPCESLPGAKTLDLNQEGAWTVALENLPEVFPQVDLFLIDSIDP